MSLLNVDTGQPSFSLPQSFLDQQAGWLNGFDQALMPSQGGFGQMNFKDKASMALAGLQTLGSLFGAFKQLSLANKQFEFQKKFANANMANSIKTYNTSIEDRARARGFTEGQTPAQIQQYVDQNRMAAWNGG